MEGQGRIQGGRMDKRGTVGEYGMGKGKVASTVKALFTVVMR